MMMKLNGLTLAVLALAATTGAQATLTLPNVVSPNTGSSSAAFVAWTPLGGLDGTSLVINLGVNLGSFLAASGTQGVPAGFVAAAGSLSAASTIANWNFSTNVFTINGASQSGTNAWSAQASSFFATSGTNYKWGVIAADAGTGPLSATNTVRGQSMLFTGVTESYDTTNANGAVAGGVATTIDYFSNNNGLGTHTAGQNGASTATSGPAFLGFAFAQGDVGNFGILDSDFLVAPGVTSRFTWATTASSPPGPTIFSIGATYAAGANSLIPASFTFDGSNLVYAVPEPGTYALMLAGLAGVGYLVRRRRAGL